MRFIVPISLSISICLPSNLATSLCLFDNISLKSKHHFRNFVCVFLVHSIPLDCLCKDLYEAIKVTLLNLHVSVCQLLSIIEEVDNDAASTLIEKGYSTSLDLGRCPWGKYEDYDTNFNLFSLIWRTEIGYFAYESFTDYAEHSVIDNFPYQSHTF